MKKKQAFSLLELSVVLVVIAILVAGVLQARNMISASRFTAARNLTKRSPVKNIPNLVLWYETTLDESFINSEIENNAEISTWYDLSGNENNATESSSAFKPLYVANSFFHGSIPGIRFDGSDDKLSFDGSIVATTAYTIFVVEQRRSADIKNYFIGGSSRNPNESLHIGYRHDTTVTQAHYYHDMDITVSAYSTPTPTIHTFRYNSADGKSYWNNGGVSPDGSRSSQINALESFEGAAIAEASVSGSNFNGDIAEIIIFNRSLKTKERQEIETYLSRKYYIDIE